MTSLSARKWLQKDWILRTSRWWGCFLLTKFLYSDDFRSNERGFDLLTQVVGRSGRGTKRGRAIIQTYTPENPVIALASHQDYVHFINRRFCSAKQCFIRRLQILS